MLYDANLVKLIGGETMLLVFHSCKVHPAFSEDTVVFCVLWEFLLWEVKCSAPVPNKPQPYL